MAQTDDNVEEELQAVKEDLNSLHKDVQALLGALGSEKETTMRDFKERLADRARVRAEQIRRSLEQAARHCSRVGENIQRHMSQHPVKSVLIALAAGALLGRLIGRER
jgi:ElaB/YqjD/DUF883 family membrane-anchored ribosome-binding protein